MATFFVGLIDGIVSIVAQYDHNNDMSNKDILKVFFHNFYVLQISLLYIFICQHKL